MVDPGIIKEWIRKAEEDHQFASINLKEKRPFYGQICFHFQQAAEKYLKAFIIANDLEFQKIHDRSLLAKICATQDRSLEQVKDDCEFLNTFYIDTRYPVHWPTNFSETEARKASQACLKIRNLVLSKLPINF